MTTSLRAARTELLARGDLGGFAFCRAFSDAADTWLNDVAERASKGNAKKLVLLAVGGYGRGELCPFSDLDLVLVHDGRGDVSAVADAIWYPVWDEGVELDHSVRSPKEVLQMAGKDLRVALGLLDARVIWGDAKVADSLLSEVNALWRTTLGASWLTELSSQMAQRHRDQGDIAFLLEPNLKESHGGLRDVNVLAAIAKYSPGLADFVDLSVIDASAALLTAVRVELHRSVNRATDKLLLQEQDQVAALLDVGDADMLMRSVSEAGGTIARISDDTWRRRHLWQPKATEPRRKLKKSAPAPVTALGGEDRVVEPFIQVIGGEVALTVDAPAAADPTLAFRLAAVAAELDLPIALGSIHRLTDLAPPPPVPWPKELLDALVRLLAAGRSAILALEAIDQRKLLSRYIPEWEVVRFHHQRNAYHRFTVDRHLLEAVANASAEADRVDRVDLLLLGTLFHDIGKGHLGDHTDVGIALVGEIGPRMGLGADDTATLQLLVRHHLLLADTAVRRDLSDPTTIERVADAVNDRETLLLLSGLTKADSMATGPAAWGTWKANLVDELVRRTLAFLDGHKQPPIASWVTDAHRSLMEETSSDGAPHVLMAPPRIAVSAPDRPGLLAAVTGTLALCSMTIRSADVISEAGVALEVFSVATDEALWPEPARFVRELTAVLDGTTNLDVALAKRTAAYAPSERLTSARPVVPGVVAVDEASASATVIEVRAEDKLALLHRLTAALFDADLDVLSARISTVGNLAVDAFYVKTQSGGRIEDPAQLEAVCQAISRVISVEIPTPA